jgi:hypothetical protein
MVVEGCPQFVHLLYLLHLQLYSCHCNLQICTRATTYISKHLGKQGVRAALAGLLTLHSTGWD